MGKRKAMKIKKPDNPRNAPLPTQFSCLFCNHDRSIVIKLDKKAGLGSLKCNICATDYQTTINYLSGPVDVYADWVDACDEVKKSAKKGYSRSGADNLPSAHPNDDDDDGGHDIMRRQREDIDDGLDDLDAEGDDDF